MNPTTVSREILRERLRDYAQQNPTELRNKLVELWREHHPEAAKEASPVHHPLIRSGWVKEMPGDPDEQWFNDVYAVTLRRHKKDPVFGSDGGMIQLGIATHEGTARHDWREMQAIKNQLAGPETEAFELFPADSRVLDPSNYYTLWCFPGVRKLKIGITEGQRIWDANISWAPQRALPPDDEPLRRAATAAWHLCMSLLACPGATEELITEVKDALEAALGGMDASLGGRGKGQKA